MTFKLSINQFDYLSDSLSRYQKDLLSKLEVKKEYQSIFIEVDKDTADEIRDNVSDELQKKGFDSNYKLTPEGKILEELIDIFYMG